MTFDDDEIREAGPLGVRPVTAERILLVVRELIRAETEQANQAATDAGEDPHLRHDANLQRTRLLGFTLDEIDDALAFVREKAMSVDHR